MIRDYAHAAQLQERHEGRRAASAYVILTRPDAAEIAAEEASMKRRFQELQAQSAAERAVAAFIAGLFTRVPA